MDSLLGSVPTDAGFFSDSPLTSLQLKYHLDVSIIATIAKDDAPRSGLDFREPYKALTVSAQEIISKLNALLKGSLPEGIESLSPDQVTPEATAERIVNSVTAFYQIFADQNPDLSDEETLDRFMEEIRKGVQQGYDDAYEILKGLGAFSFEGVQEGIEQTKILIEQKLNSFYQLKRQELGLDPTTDLSQTPEAKGPLTEESVKTLHVVA